MLLLPHPLRPLREMVDEVLKQLSRRLGAMYARTGHPSIPPEQLLRAQLLQMLYSIRSERLLMEEMDYNLVPVWCYLKFGVALLTLEIEPNRHLTRAG